jgi:hypothetical protein
MQARRLIPYSVLSGLVLAGLACAGNPPARTEETAVARDTPAARDTSAYRAMSRDTTIRDTSVTIVSDSAKSSQTNSGAAEIKPGESTDSLRSRTDTTK